MSAAEVRRPAPPLPPPITETGWIGWAKANLFNNWLSSLLTIVVTPLVILGLWFLIRWLFTADWTLITSRPQQYVIGLYPTEHAWRPLTGWLLVSLLWGMGAGIWRGGSAYRVTIAYGLFSLVVGLLPYGLFHPDVVMPWWVRLFILVNLPVLAAGFGLGCNRITGRAGWFVLGGLAAYLLFLLLLSGLPGVPGMEQVSPRQWGGLMLNLTLALFGIVLSFPIGMLLALGRRSGLPVAKLLCVGFIEIFRGVPLITLLFVSQVLVPLALPEDFPVNPVTRAAITITLFSAAYMAENIRGGLQGLPRGQGEAAQALGLAGWQVTSLILLPQAIRNVIPAIVGQFISLFKDTSLVYIIGMLDILEMGRSIVQGNVEFIDNGRELFLFVAVVFWMFTYTMSYISRRIESHLGVGVR